jgi:peptidyl-prolyl cis-trans isomerase B (cyclophilin B)
MVMMLGWGVAMLTGCGTQDISTGQVPEEDIKAANQKNELGEDTASAEQSETPKVIIDVVDYGVIELELDAKSAPITVANFVKLAKEGFYDGLTFHRIINGFMIQGGDPAGDGTGGSGETIKGEFTSNGVNNTITHKRGVVSMARSADSPDSASSQFFIVQKDSYHLDGEYAAFGQVTSGIEVVDKISEVTDIYSNGKISKKNQPVIKSIVIK